MSRYFQYGEGVVLSKYVFETCKFFEDANLQMKWIQIEQSEILLFNIVCLRFDKTHLAEN